MKKITILLLGVLLIASCIQKPQYNINGNITNGDGLKVYLSKRVGKNYVIVDSSLIENGKFLISGVAEFPELHYLEIESKNGRLNFFLENSEIQMSGNADSLALTKVQGSKVNDENVDYNNQLKPYYEKMQGLEKPYYEAQANNDTSLMSELYSKYMKINDDLKTFKIDYIKTHGTSYIVPPLVRSATVNMDHNEIEDLIKGISNDVMNTPIMIKIKGRIEALKSTAIGMPAPDFVSKDKDGNIVKFSELPKEKLLLLDFWAAWCSPCRRENPNIVKVYNEFNSNGFNVLGISLDKSKNDWLIAIEADQLKWEQWGELNYWDCEGVTNYGVVAIPTNFLIDENGIIIAKNLKGDDLYNKVKEILD